MDGALETGHGVAHLGLNATDLDGTVSRLLAEGVEVDGEPAGTGPIRFIYFTAPDGVVVELTAWKLPRRLAPALGLRLINRSIHTTRRLLARALLRAV